MKASVAYRDKKGEWMIMSSCSRFAKVMENDGCED